MQLLCLSDHQKWSYDSLPIHLDMGLVLLAQKMRLRRSLMASEKAVAESLQLLLCQRRWCTTQQLVQEIIHMLVHQSLLLWSWSYILAMLAALLTRIVMSVSLSVSNISLTIRFIAMTFSTDSQGHWGANPTVSSSGPTMQWTSLVLSDCHYIFGNFIIPSL